MPVTDYPAIEIEIRVRYAETDQMKVAHHAAYFVWFELARSEFCRSRGIDYSPADSVSARTSGTRSSDINPS